MSMFFHRGDQYSIPFAIFVNEDKATPDNVDGVRIQIGDRMCSWPGDLAFDSENGQWLYPLTQEQSLNIKKGRKKTQTAVKIGSNVIHSNVAEIEVLDSMILEVWK